MENFYIILNFFKFIKNFKKNKKKKFFIKLKKFYKNKGIFISTPNPKLTNPTILKKYVFYKF